MQPEPDFLRVFEVSEGKNTKRWRSYPVPPFAGEAPHVLSSFVARQQYAGLELVRGSLPGEEDESGSCDWVSKQVWQVAERHYVESSANTSFPDCDCVAPEGRRRALTVVQAERPPPTSCPRVDSLRCPDELDRSERHVSWTSKRRLPSCCVSLSSSSIRFHLPS